MDGISPQNNINLIRNSMPAHTAKTQKAEKSQEPKDSVSLKSLVKFSKKDLNAQGKLGVIVKADNPQELAELKEKIASDPKNVIKRDLPVINAFAAEVDPRGQSLNAMSVNPREVSIFVDGRMEMIKPVKEEDLDAHIMMDVAGKTMNIDKVWEKGYTGKGITIAVIDTGIAKHPDFGNRIKAFKDFVNNKEEAYDDQGHGTHCAGIAAGDGSSSMGKFKGAAPEASLVGVKVLNKYGSGSFSDIIAGLQYVIEKKDELGIDIISMSLGGSASTSYKDSPVAMAAEEAVKAGIITLVAAGNSGPGSTTVATPANAPHVMTVGAMDDKGTVDRGDDDIAYFSSRGPSPVDKFAKPDIVTPGVNITAPKNTGGYTTMSGTSMATPLAAGMSALIKQAAPNVTPGELKGVVMGTADKLPNAKLTHHDQGAGVFDILESIEKLTGQNI